MFNQSEAYEAFMGRWSRQLAELFLDFVEIPEGSRVLDVGSGTGSLSRAVVNRLTEGSVAGIDPAVPFVEYAREHVASDRAAFTVGDAQQIEHPDDSFDAALSMLVLNFVPEPYSAVREMARVTRPGGQVAAAVWDYPGGMEMLRHFWDAVTQLDPEFGAADERHQRLCGNGDLEVLFKDVGLSNVERSAISFVMEFESFEDYWQPFLGGQGPAGEYAASLSEADRQGLESALRSRFENADGPIRMRARAWAARGIA